MKNSSKEKPKYDVDFFLDITSEVCPLTFVKTKLLIEKMKPGEIAEIRLKGDEPLENVPRSVREHGYAVLTLDPEDPSLGKASIHRLLIRK